MRFYDPFSNFSAQACADVCLCAPIFIILDTFLMSDEKSKWLSSAYLNEHRDDYVWVGPLPEQKTDRIVVHSSQLIHAQKLVTAIDFLVDVMLDRRADDYIYINAAGCFGRMLPREYRLDRVDNAARGGATMLVEKIPAINVWLARWAEAIQRGELFDGGGEDHEATICPGVSVNRLQVAMLKISKASAQTLTIGNMADARAELVVPAQSQLLAPHPAHIAKNDCDDEIVKDISSIKELITHAGSSYFVPSKQVACSVQPGVRARLTNARPPAAVRWTYAASYTRTESQSCHDQ